MYKFSKLNWNGTIILALEITKADPIAFNFCILIRANYVWKNQVLNGSLPFTTDELNILKKKYEHSLIAMLYKENKVLVDISSGEVINPTQISKNQILEEYTCPLPF